MKKTYSPSLRTVSPKGLAKFPRIMAPDTKFDMDGVYSTKLLISPEEAGAFINEIQGIYDANLEYQAELNNKTLKALKRGPLPFSKETDHETGEETGMIEFNFKLKAKVTSKRTGITTEKSPLVVDRYGKPFVGTADGGSILRVSCEVYGWYTASLGAGVSLKMLAVQVLEARVFSGAAPATAADAGFDVEEYDEAVESDSFAETDGDF